MQEAEEFSGYPFDVICREVCARLYAYVQLIAELTTCVRLLADLHWSTRLQEVMQP
jgi:hypothetical protein